MKDKTSITSGIKATTPATVNSVAGLQIFYSITMLTDIITLLYCTVGHIYIFAYVYRPNCKTIPLQSDS